MSWEFEHVTLGRRVRLGAGEAAENVAAENVAAEVERLGAQRVLLASW